MPNGHPAATFHLPHWRYPAKLKGLSGIYINTAIRGMAFGLIGIFIPIYIYKLTGSLAHVFLFYLIRNLVMMFTVVPSAKLISKIGPDNSMFISNITASLFLICLTVGNNVPLILWLAPIFTAITINLYWLSYNSAFSSVSKNKKLSKEIANVSNISRIVSVFAPLIGGFIATEMGFQPLLLVGVLLLIISTLPIFLDEYNKREKICSFEKVEKDLLKSKERPLFLSFFFQGFSITIDVIVWPIILYTFLPNLEKIGGLTTLTLLITLFVVNWLSRRINRFHLTSFVSGNIGRSFVWLVRGISFNPFLIAATDPIYQASSIFVDLPRSIMLFRLGKRSPLSFFTKRELCLHAGRITATLLIFILLIIGLPWKIVIFLVIGGLAITTFFINQYHKTRKYPPIDFRPKFTRL